MRDHRRRIAAAVAFSRSSVGPFGWGWILFVLFLLFYPFSSGGDTSRWKDILPYGIHAVMWMGLVWSLWPVARGRRGARWILLFLLVAAGGLSEVLQGFVGRAPEWLDWGMDTLGAIVAFSWGCGCRKTGCVLAAAIATMLLVCIGAPMLEEWRAFPLLADGANRWSRYRWERNGVDLQFDGRCLRVVCDSKQPEEYPGIFRSPVRRDWTGSCGMELELFWPRSNGGDGVLGIRIDDRPRNPPYDERWQAEVPVTNGWNTIVLEHSWLQTPGGRRMEEHGICTWGVFVVSSPETNGFSLCHAHLRFPVDE